MSSAACRDAGSRTLHSHGVSSFETAHARAQVERILAHLAFPGMALVIDGDRVIARAGSVEGLSIESVERAAALASVHGLGAELRALTRELGPTVRLVVIHPLCVTTDVQRIDRAVAILQRMLRMPWATPGPGSSGGGSPAQARVWAPRAPREES